MLSYLRHALSKVGIQIRRSMFRGWGIGQLIFYYAKRDNPHLRAELALGRIMSCMPGSLLDVGSGSGVHAKIFSELGFKVTCLDMGNSIYAQQSERIDNVEVVIGKFEQIQFQKKFNYVWASHFLEHQRNAGMAIDQILANCSEGGLIAITLPFPHRNMAGGHLSLWTPGTAVYNFALAGNDMSEVELLVGSSEFSLIFTKRSVAVSSDLTFDSGDLTLLEPILPKEIAEYSDMWFR